MKEHGTKDHQHSSMLPATDSPDSWPDAHSYKRCQIRQKYGMEWMCTRNVSHTGPHEHVWKKMSFAFWYTDSEEL